jgi:hypothetical protein
VEVIKVLFPVLKPHVSGGTLRCLHAAFLDLFHRRLQGYVAQIEGELINICNDVMEVLDKHLIPSASTGETKVRIQCHSYHTLVVARNHGDAPAVARHSSSR